jgi:ADP-heptose:LPS heptosyltransferase
MGVDRWEALVEFLSNDGIGVVQAGQRRDRYVRGAYSLLGLTTPRQLISLLSHFDVVVTSDNFVMHAAHLCGTPAVVLWGPTDHRVYGYSGQIHLQADRGCTGPDGCIGPCHGNIYRTVCPEGAGQCMNTVAPETIFRSVTDLLRKKNAAEYDDSVAFPLSR